MRLLFGAFEIDLDRFEVRKDGVRRHLEPQVFEVLAHLARHRDRLVPKEELLDQVWGNRYVSESALTSRIRAARAVLDDNGRDQQVIRTVHGRGYRFVADVTDLTEPMTTAPRTTAPITAPVPAPPAAAAGRPARPVYGIRPTVLERDDELLRLAGAVDDLLAGRGGVVCVSGAAGRGRAGVAAVVTGSVTSATSATKR